MLLPINFKLNPSKYFLFILSLIFFLSLFLFFTLPFKGWLLFLGTVFLLSYGGSIFWQHGLLRAKSSIIGLSRNQQGCWFVQTKTALYPANLQGDSLVTQAICVLRFRIDKKILPWSCVIFRDSLSPDLYRRLVVTLKMPVAKTNL